MELKKTGKHEINWNSTGQHLLGISFIPALLTMKEKERRGKKKERKKKNQLHSRHYVIENKIHIKYFF